MIRSLRRRRSGAIPAFRCPSRSQLRSVWSAAIRARRSAAAFDPDPIELHALSFALASAARQPPTHGADVEVFVVAHRVSGLDPGVYRYARKTHQLAPIQRADLAVPMVSACLRQAMAGSAAVGFVMAARLERGDSAIGRRHYRDVLLESGAIAQRIYLAAEALGVAARNLAAFVDDRFNELLQLDRLGMSALHLTMFGRGR